MSVFRPECTGGIHCCHCYNPDFVTLTNGISRIEYLKKKGSKSDTEVITVAETAVSTYLERLKQLSSGGQSGTESGTSSTASASFSSSNSSSSSSSSSNSSSGSSSSPSFYSREVTSERGVMKQTELDEASEDDIFRDVCKKAQNCSICIDSRGDKWWEKSCLWRKL